MGVGFCSTLGRSVTSTPGRCCPSPSSRPASVRSTCRHREPGRRCGGTTSGTCCSPSGIHSCPGASWAWSGATWTGSASERASHDTRPGVSDVLDRCSASGGGCERRAAPTGGGTMSNWPVLQTALGLVFLFATLAVFCSGVCEVLANLLQKRAKYLLAGLHTMLDRPVTGATAPVFDGNRSAVASPVAAAPNLSKLAAQPAVAVDAAQAVDEIATQAATATQPVPEPPQLSSGGLTLALFGH